MYKFDCKRKYYVSLCLTLVLTLGLSVKGFASPVEKIDIPQLEALVAGNKGKVTIINFWATWCPPCLKEFPDIIRLYNDYNEKGLDVVAVSMNEPDEMEDIADFLEEHQPPFQIRVAATLDDEFYDGIKKDWGGIIPLTLIFNTDGKLIHYHLKEVNYEGLEEDISVLLP